MRPAHSCLVTLNPNAAIFVPIPTLVWLLACEVYRFLAMQAEHSTTLLAALLGDVPAPLPVALRDRDCLDACALCPRLEPDLAECPSEFPVSGAPAAAVRPVHDHALPDDVPDPGCVVADSLPCSDLLGGFSREYEECHRFRRRWPLLPDPDLPFVVTADADTGTDADEDSSDSDSPHIPVLAEYCPRCGNLYVWATSSPDQRFVCDCCHRLLRGYGHYRGFTSLTEDLNYCALCDFARCSRCTAVMHHWSDD